MAEPDNTAKSPVFPTTEARDPEKFDFPTAIRRVTDGDWVTRAEWSNSDYGLLRAGILHIHNSEGYHKWIVSEGDLTATDWFVIVKK